ncbi:MAG TPA: energy transducer TonB [Fluviicoccus sp.]|nr:energy transducer TonB [Fluviicoccus sp.]
MSTLAFSGHIHHGRRHHFRRQSSFTQVRAAPAAPAGAVAIEPPLHASSLEAPVRRRLALITGAILAVHLAAAWYWHTHPVKQAEAPVVIPPITVELFKPPVEPPKPLPQKKDPPPPPVVKQQQPLPAVKLPDPPPPAPVADATPVQSTVPAVEAPPAPAPVPVAQTPAPEPVTQASASASYLRNPPPVYPDFAQEQGWEGRVILKVLVSANGKAARVQVKRPSGYKLLDESALQAVQRWSFVPAKRGETPIDGWVDVPIDFKLSS